MVERDTQKGIIIGHKGAALKRVGMQAREDLEKFFGKQIHIEMFVKVNKDWRNSQFHGQGIPQVLRKRRASCSSLQRRSWQNWNIYCNGHLQEDH
jgi:ribosomal protein S3